MSPLPQTTKTRGSARWRARLTRCAPALVLAPLLLVPALPGTEAERAAAAPPPAGARTDAGPDRATADTTGSDAEAGAEAATTDDAPGGIAPPAGLRPVQRVLAALPGGLGPCLGPACPDPSPAADDGTAAGRDENVNVFVGGDFLVRGGAAGAEGRVVTLGAFDQNTSRGGEVYRLGEVGAGSRVPPPAGAEWLSAGGDVRVARGQRLLAEGGVVRHAGVRTGTVQARTVADPAAAADYRELRGELSEASSCYAEGADGSGRPATGTAVNRGGATVLTGDGTSRLQVFQVDFDLTGPGGRPQALRFAGIPADATVLVNVLGDARTVNTDGGGTTDGGALDRLRPRLLWNFPTAQSIALRGTGRFQGSVLAGNRASTTSVTLPGVNGRLLTAGSLTHGSDVLDGSGQQIHAHPFLGDLPDCGGSDPLEGVLTVVEQDADTGEKLPGAVFQLWRETNGVRGLQTEGADADTRADQACVTDPEGRCRSRVELGAYYWQEVAPPDGYDLADPSVLGPLRLTEANHERGVSVTVPRHAGVPDEAEGSLTVDKRDARTDEPLAGAVFELWRETGGVPGLQTRGADRDLRTGPGCTTDDRGACVFGELRPGVYHLRETAVPEGYRLPDTPVRGPYLVDPGRTPHVTVTLANEPGGGDKGKAEKGTKGDKGPKEGSGGRN